ncbi:MAG: type II toxin-antitoxin system RelE/ParE family toxin [Novosphingobium sp.]|uniref:type II toxin-antitoxin system RelE/ParE family toxin n=1 Tax=Novosphingobium sp. TaxID=1874826 RepID=UPI0027338CC1|nr:type II toxin-antitoxin system RelE/ParE family toxin [Novosphingobium sp.]MDP3548936.1 type II toxin-antitoxin system RelE/ParE family toxin [Novosphingobium sp.]
MSDNIDNGQNVSYTGQVFKLSETPDFSDWLGSLRDRRARARIVVRLERLADGNFGDSKSVKGGVHELRVDYGPGYRVYFFQRGKELVILLCGGDKRTQDADIAHAKRLKEEIERTNGASPI